MNKIILRVLNRKELRLFAISMMILVFLPGCIISDTRNEMDFTGVVAVKDGAIAMFIAKEPIIAIHVEISNLSRLPEILSQKNALEFSYVRENTTVIVLGFPETVEPGETLFYLTDLPGSELDDLFIAYASASPNFTSSGDSSLEEPRLIGDFSGDGIVDIVDFGRFVGAYGSKKGDVKFNPAYDINTSERAYGGVWANIYSIQPPDAPDDEIDIKDFGIFVGNYLKKHPYLGTWTFEGDLEERDTAEYGKVSGSGSGTAEVTMANHVFHVSVDADIEINTEKEGTIEFNIEMHSSDPELDFTFVGGVMTFSGTLKIPGDDTEYTGILQGSLKQEGNNIYTQVENGTIKLEGQEEVLGTWTAEKQ